MLKEIVVNFGPSGGLVGILTRIADPQADAVSDLAVVFLNAGVIHRVGPNRMHVRLARALAAGGTPCFRFDLPGIGDSRTLGTSESVVKESLTGVAAALDLLEHQKIATRFVLFGLCSGADYAFMAGCLDPRVVGLALIDPTRSFVTWRARGLWLLRWAIRPAGWLRLARGHYRLIPKVVHHVRSRHRRPGTREAHTQPSPRDERQLTEQALMQLVKRRVLICLVMTTHLRGRFNYRRQFFDTFPGIGLEEFTRVEIFAEGSHTFDRESDRVRLEALLVEWVESVPRPFHVAATT